MNPEYQGRGHIPDNLRNSLRPLAVVKPDAAKIAEVLLAPVDDVVFGGDDAPVCALDTFSSF